MNGEMIPLVITWIVIIAFNIIAVPVLWGMGMGKIWTGIYICLLVLIEIAIMVPLAGRVLGWC